MYKRGIVFLLSIALGLISSGCGGTQTVNTIIKDKYVRLKIETVIDKAWGEQPDIYFTIDFNDEQTIYAPDQGKIWPDISPEGKWIELNWTHDFHINRLTNSATIAIKMWDNDDLTNDDLMAGEVFTFNPMDDYFARIVQTTESGFTYSLTTVSY